MATDISHPARRQHVPERGKSQDLLYNLVDVDGLQQRDEFPEKHRPPLPEFPILWRAPRSGDRPFPLGQR
jgi:hypothetical protein